MDENKIAKFVDWPIQPARPVVCPSRHVDPLIVEMETILPNFELEVVGPTPESCKQPMMFAETALLLCVVIVTIFWFVGLRALASQLPNPVTEPKLLAFMSLVTGLLLASTGAAFMMRMEVK